MRTTEPVRLRLLEAERPRGYCAQCGARLTTRTGIPLRESVPGVLYLVPYPTMGWAAPPGAPHLLFCNRAHRRRYVEAVRNHPSWTLTTESEQ